MDKRLRNGCSAGWKYREYIIPALRRLLSRISSADRLSTVALSSHLNWLQEKDAACRFLDRIELDFHAVSMGGMESLATRPAMSSHRGMTSEARLRAGISDSLSDCP